MKSIRASDSVLRNVFGTPPWLHILEHKYSQHSCYFPCFWLGISWSILNVEPAPHMKNTCTIPYFRYQLTIMIRLAGCRDRRLDAMVVRYLIIEPIKTHVTFRLDPDHDGLLMVHNFMPTLMPAKLEHSTCIQIPRDWCLMSTSNGVVGD